MLMSRDKFNKSIVKTDFPGWVGGEKAFIEELLLCGAASIHPGVPPERSAAGESLD